MHVSSLLFIAYFIKASVSWTLPQLVLADPIVDECECKALLNRTTTDGKDYVCEDLRLGPTALPNKLILGTVMSRYDRFGMLTPVEFIDKWWDVKGGRNKTGGWRYPDDGGFLLDERGHPVKVAMRLEVGTLVDRFGGEYGKYLSLAASPFSQRSLPPDSLNTDEKCQDFPNGYHVYNVTKAFTVEAGPIRPWFGQPGLGTQFYTGGEAFNRNVSALVNEGYLKFVASTHLDIVKTGCGQ